MKKFVICLCLVAVCQSMMTSRARGLRRWATGKVYEKCIGEEDFNAEKKDMNNIRQTCLQRSPKDVLPADTMKNMDAIAANNKDIDEKFIKHMTSNLGNYTCVLSSMKFIDASNMIDSNGVTKRLEAMIKDPALRSSMATDVEDCLQLSKSAPKRLVDKVTQHFNFLNEAIIRQGIFFQCFRARMMMTCVAKAHQEMKTNPHPSMALAIARIPRLDDENDTFEEIYTPMADDGVWFTFAP